MDIEALAKAAGSEAWDIWRDKRGALCISVDGVSLTDELEKFAELVASQAAAEAREECAKTCEDKEREFDAKGDGWYDWACGAADCAVAIRRKRSNV